MRRHSTARFFASRVLGGLVVFLVVSFLIFSFLFVAPGSPEQAILGAQNTTPAAVEEVRTAYGFDDPFLVQYGRFVERAVRLDFGRSYQTGETVTEGILQRLEITVPLAIAGFLLASLMGIAGGIVAGHRAGSPLDRGLVGSSVVWASVPAYATGVLLLYVFGLWLGWLPISGAGDGLADRVTHLVLPAVTLGLVGSAAILRMTRLAIASAVERDDVAFARARGVPRRDVLARYILRHALVTIVTACAIVLIYMLVATAVVEVTFGINGIGAYLLESIRAKDIPSVQGVAMLATAIVVVVNLLADVTYRLIDPRIQYGHAAA